MTPDSRTNRFLNRRFGGSEEGSYTGVSDLVMTPINLGWHLGQFHIMAFGNVYAPVGSYNPERRLNTGLNRWALEPNVAVTWLHPKYGQEVSISMGYTFNSKIPPPSTPPDKSSIWSTSWASTCPRASPWDWPATFTNR